MRFACHLRGRRRYRGFGRRDRHVSVAARRRLVPRAGVLLVLLVLLLTLLRCPSASRKGRSALARGGRPSQREEHVSEPIHLHASPSTCRGRRTRPRDTRSLRAGHRVGVVHVVLPLVATTADTGESKRRHDGTDDPPSGVSEGRGRGAAVRVVVEEEWRRVEVEQQSSRVLVLWCACQGPL